MFMLDRISGVLRQTGFVGNSFQQWAIALAVAIGVGVTLRLAKGLLARRAEALSKVHPRDWLDIVVDLLRHTSSWFLLILSLYCGTVLLVLPGDVVRFAAAAAVIALLVQAAVWGDALVKLFFLRQARRRVESDAGSATTLVALSFVGRVTVWTIAILLVLANLGIDVTAMVAGLGIGGIAVALAAQNILGDLFASASIVLDKPFILGDFIVVGQEMGTVEHIGLKTTRLRSLSGEQLIFANNDVLKSRIRNFKRMSERRVVFTLGVTYQTPPEKLAMIPAILREVVESQSPTRFDRAHFKQYGDFALIFEIVYYMLAPDYNLFMDIQQAVNLAVFQHFAREQIEFAYPTQVVYLQK